MAADITALHDALRAIVADDRDAAQDALDVAAVAAAIKPAAVFGLAGETSQRIERLAAASFRNGLITSYGRAWLVAGEGEGLPQWFTEALAEQRGRVPIVVIGARAPALRLTTAEEARLMGFPPCCTAAHARRTRDLHFHRARRIGEATNDDALRRRMTLAGVEFAARDAEERALLAHALDVSVAPFTALALCASCAGNDGSPGAQFSQRMGQLAAATGLAKLIDANTRAA